jgi:hypothetical protein
MPTYLEIFKSLPAIEESRPTALKYTYVYMASCALLAAALVGWGWHANSVGFIYGAYIPLFLLPAILIVNLVADIREMRRRGIFQKDWGLVRLDQRVSQEKSVATELAKLALSELKWMAQRLETEALTRERWLDVTKPFAILLPAALVIVGVDTFHLPAMVQDFGKVAASAMLIGITIGAISIYESILPLRRLASAVQCAIASIEGRKAPAFRKVSRKRHAK